MTTDPGIQPDLLIALIAFCAVTLFTPGPNNIMLMTSALNFGVRRTLAHMTGVAGGFGIMVAGVGFGLGTVFRTWPQLYPVLKYAGAAYLLYLAWKIANAGPPVGPVGPTGHEKGHDKDRNRGQPMTFLQAAAFQWVNPKAWSMAVGAISAYGAVAAFPLNVITMAAIYAVMGLASGALWVGFGYSLQRIITNPRAVRTVNIAMALLLVACLYPILADGAG